jgi:hypothetical protein
MGIMLFGLMMLAVYVSLAGPERLGTVGTAAGRTVRAGVNLSVLLWGVIRRAVRVLWMPGLVFACLVERFDTGPAIAAAVTVHLLRSLVPRTPPQTPLPQQAPSLPPEAGVLWASALAHTEAGLTSDDLKGLETLEAGEHGDAVLAALCRIARGESAGQPSAATAKALKLTGGDAHVALRLVAEAVLKRHATE